MRTFPAMVLSASLLLGFGLPQPASCDCAPDTIGIPPESWNASRSPFLGNAVGETFYATDTLISKLTVWRPPNNLDDNGVQLFIVAVDSINWNPPRPDTRAILFYGPTVLVHDSSPPGNLIEMAYVIDPPLGLPRPGYYAWFVLPAPGSVDIIANDTNPYPRGMYWITYRASGGLAPVAGGEEGIDLIFRVEFCNTNSTPARRQTWGDLKLLYR